MPGQNDFHGHLCRALHDRVEVLYLEPQQHAVPIRLVVPIADPAVMVFHFKAVQLQDELAVRHQALVLRAAVITVQTYQTLIPLAACFHISDCDERLRAHRKLV